MSTQVKFLIEVGGDILAFFPAMPHSFNGYRIDNLTCYSHVGQHSACHIDYANECIEANFNQYQDLLKELVSQGYNDLLVVNSQSIECHPPTKGGIKFGEGATYYRSFTVGEIGISKKGNLKAWFKADDGLRYSTK